MNSFATILAQTTAPSTGPAPKEGPAFLQSQFIPILLGLAVLWIFMLRSKNGDEKKRKNMLSQLKKGDEIQTIGGIIGKVVEAREDRVLVKVDETANTKIWFSRNAIHRVLEEEKAESK